MNSEYKEQYDYIPQLPHLENWSKGIEVKDIKSFKKNSDCSSYYNRVNKIKSKSDSNNYINIILKKLPSSKNKDIYLRYWAAEPGDYKDSFKKAYQEFDSKYEKMPSANYNNGGMVKISAAGISKFRLKKPSSYKDKKSGYYIPPHFHYRLCENGVMGPVHTEYLKNNKDCTICHKNP